MQAPGPAELEVGHPVSGIRAIPCVTDGVVTGYAVFCPACQCGHKFSSPGHPNDNGSGWAFNGNKSLPTFTGSMLVKEDDSRHRCHSSVTDGRITFFDDCTHPFSGRTIDLPAFPGTEDDGK